MVIAGVDARATDPDRKTAEVDPLPSLVRQNSENEAPGSRHVGAGKAVARDRRSIGHPTGQERERSSIQSWQRGDERWVLKGASGGNPRIPNESAQKTQGHAAHRRLKRPTRE